MQYTHCKLTRQGYEELKTKRDELVENARNLDAVMSEISLSEDTSENMEYLEMRRKRIILADDIAHLASILESAEILNRKIHSKAQEGSTIHIGNHQICHIIQLVDPIETNSLNGKISSDSPMGTALVGRRVGEEVNVATPAGHIKFNIVAMR
jgi:transcription elongation factor GreA